MLQAAPWLHNLANTPQDPYYHAEGNVLIHTRLVAEALVANLHWRQLPPIWRTILFVAALLHDIGKPDCTEIGPDGRITAEGHARLGAGLARRLLWEGAIFGSVPALAVRETIVALVRLHGLPIWFLEKADSLRAVVLASWRVPLDMLALLAEADARGRICHDLPELLDRIELFREQARELACFIQPFPFGNNQSRVRYYHRLQNDPHYTAYDDTAFDVIVLSGLPGAGKDTWIKQHVPMLPMLSLDAVRAELGIAPNQPQGAVFQRAKEQARVLLRAQTPFVWNATNVSRRLRMPLIAFFLGYRARVRLVYLDAPLDLIRLRNQRRPQAVPAKLITKLVRQFDLPEPGEAHLVEYVDFSLEEL